MDKYDPLVNSGDHARLKRAMSGALRGEKLCVAFIGGSITEGYSSTSHDKCYAKRIHDWWVRTFPDSGISYLNAGIGGTGSDYGCARVERDVLSHKPDVVFVYFTVNDPADDHYIETYEGLIRHLLLSPSQPAVVLLHFVQYDSGISAQQQHLKIGRHYGLPCISCVNSMYAKLKDGLLTAADFTQDMLHPNDKGHGMIADMVTDFLSAVLEEEETAAAAPVPSPLSANAWEAAELLQHKDIDAQLKGFEKDTKEPEYPADHFRGGWSGKKAGDEIVFKINCSEAAVQFRRTIRRPAPIAVAIVDGDEENAVILDSNFDQDWGDCLSVVNVLHHGRVVTDQTCRDLSPARYENAANALAKHKDVTPVAAEHELKIRIIGAPDELGWKMGETSTGGPAWLKSESKDGAASFDLLAVFISSPA